MFMNANTFDSYLTIQKQCNNWLKYSESNQFQMIQNKKENKVIFFVCPDFQQCYSIMGKICMELYQT